MKALFSNYILFIISVLFLANTVSCSSPGGQKISDDIVRLGAKTANDPKTSKNDNVLDIEEPFKHIEGLITSYNNETDVAKKKGIRDKIVRYYILQITHFYTGVERKYIRAKQWTDFSADVVELGLTTAATAAGGTQTKTILSGIATMINGAQISADSNILKDFAIEIITRKMNENRTTKVNEILKKLTELEDKDYPLSVASIDLLFLMEQSSFVYAKRQLLQGNEPSAQSLRAVKLAELRAMKLRGDIKEEEYIKQVQKVLEAYPITN